MPRRQLQNVFFCTVFPSNFTYPPCNPCLYLDPVGAPNSDAFQTPKLIKIAPKRDLKRTCFLYQFWSAFWINLEPLGHPLGPKTGRKTAHEPAWDASWCRLGELQAARNYLKLLGWPLDPSGAPSLAIGLHFGPSGTPFWTLPGSLLGAFPPPRSMKSPLESPLERPRGVQEYFLARQIQK